MLFRQKATIRRLIAAVGGKPLQAIRITHNNRSGEIHRIDGNMCINIGHIQIHDPVDSDLVIHIDGQSLHDFQLLPGTGKKHIVGQRTGERRHHIGVADVGDHPAERHFSG